MSATRHGRLSAALTAVATLALRLLAAHPAWANAVSPELNPNAAQDYNRMMWTVFGTVFGIFGLIVIVMIVIVVFAVRWMIKQGRTPPPTEEQTVTPHEGPQEP